MYPRKKKVLKLKKNSNLSKTNVYTIGVKKI